MHNTAQLTGHKQPLGPANSFYQKCLSSNGLQLKLDYRRFSVTVHTVSLLAYVGDVHTNYFEWYSVPLLSMAITRTYVIRSIDFVAKCHEEGKRKNHK